METINDRMELLVNERCNGNKAAFATAIGLAPTGLSNYLGNKRRSKPSIDLVLKIAQVFDVDVKWLMTGVGEIKKQDAPATQEQDAYKLIPLVHIDSVGGMHSLNSISDEPQYIERLVPFVDGHEGDLAIYQSGDSMTPTIPPGSIIQIREVKLWREYLGYGGIYVLLLTDGRRLTKELQRYDPDPLNYVVCVSHNPAVHDEELPKSLIAGVWKVVKILIDKGW